jgi:flagellar biosynthesis/type III secretory pathway M-ring protein FliF/YscJ
VNYFDLVKLAAPEIGVVVTALIVLAVGFLLIIKPLLNRLLSSPEKATPAAIGALPGTQAVALPPGERPKTVEEIQAEMESELMSEAQAGWRRRLPVLTKHLAAKATSDPQNTAKMLRSWMSEDK